MPIETTCACNNGILEISIEGVPEAQEVVALVHECYGKFSFMHAIWDFRRSSLSGFGASAFERIAAAAARFAAERGPGAKTAMLVNDPSEIILLKAYAASASETLPVGIQGFLDETAARRWLAE